MKTAIQTTNLTKQYPGKAELALKSLNLSVEQGEIFGYLGPNGAGKTTTIHLILDFIKPTSGSVSVLGMDVRQNSTAVRRLIGNLPGELHLWENMTGRQVLRYLASLRPDCDLKYADSLAERLELDLDVRSGNYSTGNKRKVGIIQAMMHRPPIIVLDEPTTGLDPLVRQTFHDLLREARENGQTVFLSSHVLSEVQSVCDRVAILRRGQLELVEQIRKLNVKRAVTIYSTEEFIPEAWERLPNVVSVEIVPGVLRLMVDGSLDPIIKFAANYKIHDMRVETPNLESIFMEFYSDD